MVIKSFPKALYRGNSVNKTFSIKDTSNNSTYEFQVGDILELAIKRTVEDSDNYILYKKFEITSVGTEMNIILTPEETKNIPEDQTAILEIKLTYNNGASAKTVYQDKIELKGVVIDE